jgi:hypothetical protein
VSYPNAAYHGGTLPNTSMAFSLVYTSVQTNADPDPAFYVNADPDTGILMTKNCEILKPEKTLF